MNNHQNVAWQPDKSEGEMSSSRVTRTDTDIGTIHGIFPIPTRKNGLSTSIVETAFTFSAKEDQNRWLSQMLTLYECLLLACCSVK